MENKTVLHYEEATETIKRKVVRKYLAEKEQVFFTVTRGDTTLKAIQVWYQGIDYVVLIDKNDLVSLEWSSYQELQNQEEMESFYRLGYLDDFLEGDLGYC